MFGEFIPKPNYISDLSPDLYRRTSLTNGSCCRFLTLAITGDFMQMYQKSKFYSFKKNKL